MGSYDELGLTVRGLALARPSIKGYRPVSGARITGDGLRGTSEGCTLPRMGEDATGRQKADTPEDIPLPVPEAARALGISPEAVRNRLSRGTLKSIKRGGRVLVLIDHDMARPTERHTGDIPSDTSDLVEALRQQIASLERQLENSNEANRENRRIIAALTSRIPQLEAPSETPGAPETDAEPGERVEPQPEPADAQEGVQRRSWWWRVFGG